jgi:hypothetical protein
MSRYDTWKSTEPPIDLDPEFRFEDEPELEPEPTIDEVWDGARAEYVTTVTLDDRTLTIRTARSGPYVGDYEITGPDGFYSDGWITLDRAIARATDHLLDGRS